MKTIKLTLLITTFGLLVSCGPSTLDKEKSIKINIGDSLFMKSPTDRKSFISVGNIKRVPIMDEEELRRLNYSRKDTLGFESDLFDSKNAEECFYKSGSTFIGMCVGKDSAQTEYGLEYYVKVKPSKCLQKLISESVTLKQQKTYHVEVDGVFTDNQLKNK